MLNEPEQLASFNSISSAFAELLERTRVTKTKNASTCVLRTDYTVAEWSFIVQDTFALANRVFNCIVEEQALVSRIARFIMDLLTFCTSHLANEPDLNMDVLSTLVMLLEWKGIYLRVSTKRCAYDIGAACIFVRECSNQCLRFTSMSGVMMPLNLQFGIRIRSHIVW
jgi:hypothetical protein